MCIFYFINFNVFIHIEVHNNRESVNIHLKMVTTCTSTCSSLFININYESQHSVEISKAAVVETNFPW